MTMFSNLAGLFHLKIFLIPLFIAATDYLTLTFPISTIYYHPPLCKLENILWHLAEVEINGELEEIENQFIALR